MSWDPSMGYYGGSFDADDEYEEQDDYQPPQQRQRNAPKSPGLRQHMKAITQENRQLKKELEDSKAALMELMEGDSPQASNGAYPRSTLTDAERLQVERMQSMGVLGVASPSGTQAEQISRINNARTPQELTEYLRSQGSVIGTNYEGMGY